MCDCRLSRCMFPLCACDARQRRSEVPRTPGACILRTRAQIEAVAANLPSPFVPRPRRGPLSNLPLIAVSVALVWGLAQTAGIWKNVTSKNKKDAVRTRSSLPSSARTGVVACDPCAPLTGCRERERCRGRGGRAFEALRVRVRRPQLAGRVSSSRCPTSAWPTSSAAWTPTVRCPAPPHCVPRCRLGLQLHVHGLIKFAVSSLSWRPAC